MCIRTFRGRCMLPRLTRPLVGAVVSRITGVVKIGSGRREMPWHLVRQPSKPFVMLAYCTYTRNSLAEAVVWTILSGISIWLLFGSGLLRTGVMVGGLAWPSVVHNASWLAVR